MELDLFLKNFLERWGQTEAWLTADSLDSLARFKERHDIVKWVREYCDSQRQG